MALMDEFKEDRNAILKHGTLKEKTKYIWDYYKWHIILPILAVACIIWYIVHLITATDIILNGVFLNVYKTESTTSGEELKEDFYKVQKIDTSEEEITLNTNLYYSTDVINGNYETLQVLMAWHSAGSLDFIGGDLPTLTDFTYRGYFCDLRDILTEEQIAKYEPYFLYMDQDFYIRRSEMASNMEDVSSLEYPDCTKPDEMVEPIPVLIDMKQSEKFSKLYAKRPEIMAFGITANVENKEVTLSFLDYLFE